MTNVKPMDGRLSSRTPLYLIIPFLLATLLLAACSRQDEPRFPEPESLPALQAQVSTNTPRVGDIIEVDILLTSEDRLVLPPWSEVLQEDIRLLDHQTPPATRDENGRWQQNARLRVALYSVTDVPLFTGDSLQTLNDPPASLNLPFISLSVEALTDEDTVPSLGNMDLMDFRGSEALRRARRNRWLSLLGLLLILALIFWIRHRIQQRPVPPPPPPRWDKIALRKMEELRQSTVWLQADADASAVALSTILREYIEGRFSIHAPDLTTEEFLLEASVLRLGSEAEQTELEGFFRAVDRIKFAAERPGADALNGLMQAAERFVRVTGQANGQATGQATETGGAA